MIMRRMTIALTAAVLAASGLASAGWTQISRSSAPFMINADDVEFDEQRGLIS